MKLTPAQQKVFDELKKGGTAWRINGLNPYWFISGKGVGASVRCTKQIEALAKMGLIEVKKDGIGYDDFAMWTGKEPA